MGRECFPRYILTLAAIARELNVHGLTDATVDDSIINRVLRFGTADIQEDYLTTIRTPVCPPGYQGQSGWSFV